MGSFQCLSWTRHSSNSLTDEGIDIWRHTEDQFKVLTPCQVGGVIYRQGSRTRDPFWGYFQLYIIDYFALWIRLHLSSDAGYSGYHILFWPPPYPESSSPVSQNHTCLIGSSSQNADISNRRLVWLYAWLIDNMLVWWTSRLFTERLWPLIWLWSLPQSTGASYRFSNRFSNHIVSDMWADKRVESAFSRDAFVSFQSRPSNSYPIENRLWFDSIFIEGKSLHAYANIVVDWRHCVDTKVQYNRKLRGNILKKESSVFTWLFPIEEIPVNSL